jgi:hypothetical protein
LAGGLNAEVYSPNGGCSNSLPPLPEESATPHLAYIKEKLIYCPAEISQQCYIYNAESNTWSPYTSTTSLHTKTPSNIFTILSINVFLMLKVHTKPVFNIKDHSLLSKEISLLTPTPSIFYRKCLKDLYNSFLI